jgi:urea carboxylase-associated protein 1
MSATTQSRAPATTTVLDEVVAARAPWSAVVAAGHMLSIVDLGGNQAVDCLLYRAQDTSERYSAADTIAAQGSIFLTTGSVLRSCEGRALMTVVADDVGRHDTIGGACSKESNTLRYGHHTRHQHACVENFLREGAKWGLGKRDLVSNINWYMNVPVEADGTLGIVDGLSAPGLTVSLRAEVDTLVLVSNCPQVNNPCNGFDPTPVRMVVAEGLAQGARLPGASSPRGLARAAEGPSA